MGGCLVGPRMWWHKSPFVPTGTVLILGAEAVKGADGGTRTILEDWVGTALGKGAAVLSRKEWAPPRRDADPRGGQWACPGDRLVCECM